MLLYSARCSNLQQGKIAIRLAFFNFFWGWGGGDGVVTKLIILNLLAAKLLSVYYSQRQSVMIATPYSPL